ncbi:MAG: HPF/RaiA family ribosome-associated protein [Bdellovibrionaceae bacterium]|nr:HPF/RaiA family ribosome-associated protein [Pseudobdellovibrionaceae bacterium]
MNTTVFFRDIGKTEALENYLEEKVAGATEGFMKYDHQTSLTVRIETERRRTENRKPAFICELILKPSHQKGTLKVRKNGEDFHTAVNDATAALRTILRRRSTRRSQHRRHEHDRELSDLLAVS